MAKNITTIIKIYLLFFTFVIGGNVFIELMPSLVPSMSQENTEYISFITTKLNGEFDPSGEGETLLTNFQSSLTTTNLFTGGLAQQFLGVLIVVGQLILFIVNLAVSLLFVPTTIIEILLYNFIASTTSLFLVGLVVNIFFYMQLFYIIFRARTKQN